MQQVSRLIPNQLTHFHPNEVLGANQQLVAYGGLQAGSASALIENARLRAEIEAEKKMGNEKAARTAAEATATTLREERANRAFQEHERELVRREQQRKDEEQRAAQKRAEIEVQFKHQQELERVRMQHELVLNRERQAHALQQQQQFLQAVKQGNADVVQQLKDHVTETARKQPVEGAVREDIHGYTNNLADRFANAHNGMPSRSSYESPPAKRKPYKSPAGTTYKELLGKKLEDFTDSDEDSVATAPPKQSKPVQHQWSSNAANVENKIPKYKKVEAPLFIDTSFSIDAAEEGGILDATPADRARKACFRSPHPRKPLEEKVAVRMPRLLYYYSLVVFSHLL